MDTVYFLMWHISVQWKRTFPCTLHKKMKPFVDKPYEVGSYNDLLRLGAQTSEAVWKISDIMYFKKNQGDSKSSTRCTKVACRKYYVDVFQNENHGNPEKKMSAYWLLW